jgi:microcystin degradation protein MlrC
MLNTTAVISYTISCSVTQKYLNYLHVEIKFLTYPHVNSLAAKRKQTFPKGFEKM